MKILIVLALVFLPGQTIGLGQPGALSLRYAIVEYLYKFPAPKQVGRPKNPH